MSLTCLFEVSFRIEEDAIHVDLVPSKTRV
jgi:hypothetical protein